jgi:hypothetical protein
MNSDNIVVPPEGSISIVPLTKEGKDRLSEIVKEARQGKSYRNFKIVGLSYETVRNLENKKYNEVRRKTLEELAPHTTYNLEQLIAICQTGPRIEVQDSLVLATDLWELVSVHPVEKQLQLIERILTESSLDKNQVARIQRAIALWLEEK